MYAYHILMLHVYPINVCVCVYMCFSLLVVPMLPCFFMLQMLNVMMSCVKSPRNV